MLPFVGPSYCLNNKKADIQRAINMYLVAMETPGKASFYMDSIAGYVQEYDLGEPVRGALKTNDRAFVVAGAQLYELFSDGTSIVRGALASTSGAVGMAYGLFQLVVVDGPSGYVFTLETNAWQTITSEGFSGSSTVVFLGNFFIFIRPDTQQFYIASVNDATAFDPLDFASAESSPDDLVGMVVDNEELRLMGTVTTESWALTGGADFPFSKRGGASMDVGCTAWATVQNIDNSSFWLGQDKNGAGIVYRAQVYQPERISTRAVEEALQKSTDLGQAGAYCYQENGLTFYCLNAPGLETTWVYEVASGQWHERADLADDGGFEPLRMTCHMHAFGKHLFGSPDGKVYRSDAKVHKIGADPLVRERISPHSVAPGRTRQIFNAFVLDCETGGVEQGIDPQAELSYSSDSGGEWSNPSIRSIGKVGGRFARVVFRMLGQSRDRVWKLRFSGNAPFSIVNVDVDAKAGR